MIRKGPQIVCFILLLCLILLSGITTALAAPELTISNYQLVDSKRISRTVFEYTYKAEITNTGSDAVEVTATLSVDAPGVTVLDGELSFGDVPAGASVESSNTFSILHNRQHSFGVDALMWSVEFETGIVAVSATAGEGGTISPANQDVNTGTPAIFTVTPEPGYVIDSVHGCGGTLDATLYTTAPITAACTVTAAFTPDDNPIQLSAPVVEGALLPGSAANLRPRVRYSGDGFLDFSLLESPPGMTVNARTGHLRWTPTDVHAGQVFTVQLSATDGETSSSVAFSVRVAQPTLVATTSEVLDDGRTRITVTDTDLALDGLEVFLPEDFIASDYVTSVREGIPGITLINPSDVPSPDSFSPETDILLTEFFRIDPVSIGTDYIAVLLPPVELPAGRYSEELMLYVYERPVGISAAQGPIWTPVTHGLRVTEDGRALIMIAVTGQPMVVGIEAVLAAATESTPGAFWYPLATPVAGRDTVPIECESDSRRIDLQLCTIEFPRQFGACSLDGLTDCKAKIRIRDFSENNWTNPPADFSAHHVAGWAADALVKFNTLGLPFDAWTDALTSTRDVNIEVKIRDINRLINPCSYTALVKPVNNYRVLHLNASNACAREHSVQTMKSALVHEYFHHAQARVEKRLYPLFEWRSTVLSDEVREWLYEGTAVWFQDEVYDHHDFYLGFGLPRVLDRGLASETQPADAFGFGVPVPEPDKPVRIVVPSYDRAPFFKLLQRRGDDVYGCDFTAINSDERTFLAEIFTGHSRNDDGAGRLLDAISDPSFSCGFGSVFGAENRMANALEYYTYATQIKQDIRLLDRSERPDIADWTFQLEDDGETYPLLAPWGREGSVTMQSLQTRVLDLPPLSSIVVRLNDQQSDMASRTLKVWIGDSEGDQAFVSLRNSEGEDPKPKFVSEDINKILGYENWDGWFLTFVNADPEQRTRVGYDVFTVAHIPLAVFVRDPDGNEYEFEGKRWPQSDGTSLFELEGPNGISCSGELDASGEGTLTCNNGWTFAIAIPQDVYEQASGSYILSHEGFVGAIGWGANADVDVLSQLANTGGLQVTITPSAAITAGAQWRRANTNPWLDSGTTETDIPVGGQTVEFKAISGWTAPSNKAVNIRAGETKTLTIGYEQSTQIPISENFLWPVTNPGLTQSYAAFNVIGNNKYHTGFDLVSQTGDLTVYAAAAGTVRTIPSGTFANENRRMGHVIIIDHNNGQGPFTLYAHLATFYVADGVEVQAGDPIGVMGNTGCANLPDPCGVHLHFEVKQWGVLGNLDDNLGPAWGYAEGFPNLYGYLNPWPYLDHGWEVWAPRAVRSLADQIVRTGPGAEYSQVLGTVVENQTFMASQQVNDWFEIDFPSEHGPAKGWIQGTAAGNIPHWRVTDSVRGLIGVSVCPTTSACASSFDRLSYVWDLQRIVELDRAPAQNGCSKPWVKTALLDDATGWVCSDFLTVGSSASAGTGRLNDTGIDWCADGDTNFLACPVALYPGQDGDYGRDAAARAGTLDKVGAGAAGFDYTKLDADGHDLPASALNWSCVRDNVTGLIWEVKVDDPGHLRHKEHTYTWYNPDPNTNGGNAGTQDGGNCTGSACDIHAFVQAVNAQRLCGASDWRMPTRQELQGIVDYGQSTPVIDTGYFPNTPSGWFWSGSPHANHSNYAWNVYFNDGYAGNYYRSFNHRVRLVRGGQ